jgi:Flp pilus assembly protein TadD
VEKDGQHLPGYFQMKKVFFFFLILHLCGCSLPKIVVIEDPLTAQQHNDLGVVYLKKGQYELAQKEYLKALKLQKNWAVPYFNLGNLFYQINDFKEAEKYYRKALDVDQGNADVMNNLAYLLYREGKTKEALELINQAINIEKKEEYLKTLQEILDGRKESF